jgi:hypothetical protein
MPYFVCLHMLRESQGLALRITVNLKELPNLWFVNDFSSRFRFHAVQVFCIPILKKANCFLWYFIGDYKILIKSWWQHIFQNHDDVERDWIQTHHAYGMIMLDEMEH